MAEPYVNPAELPVKRRENIALGVLGALLFSAAGGLVHFGLLQLGYIAWISALVGMAAGYFGYGLFSGRKNTVHGAILAVVFTMLMIVAANISVWQRRSLMRSRKPTISRSAMPWHPFPIF